jgi:DNA-binding CsgD family transcriptional regulator
MDIDQYDAKAEHGGTGRATPRDHLVRDGLLDSSATLWRCGNSRLRLLARECDAAQGVAFDLSWVWYELVSGNWKFNATFSTADRLYALFEPIEPHTARPIAAHHCRVLARYLIGESQKSLAIELGLSPSAVTCRIQYALKAMGLAGCGSRAPLLLAVAAHARQAAPAIRGRRSQLALPDGRSLWVISVRRPDLEFPARLSAAEAAVVRELVAGRSHAQIASLRRTSLRTVANQLAAVFRKLSVSGRGELIACLVSHSANHALQHAHTVLAPRSIAQGASFDVPSENGSSQTPAPPLGFLDGFGFGFASGSAVDAVAGG